MLGATALGATARLGATAESLMVDALFVPESMGVDTLLGLLRQGGFQIAIATDEYGGTAGLVTLEDLVEEIVGDLEDEHDRSRVGLVRKGLTVTFDAGLRPDELFDRAGIRVPDDGDYETVAGFVADELDRLPEVGDEVAVAGGVLRVERVDGPRLERLRYTPEARGTSPEPVASDVARASNPAAAARASAAAPEPDVTGAADPARASSAPRPLDGAPATDHDRVVTALREDLS